jgi:hypothetical protein
LIRDRFPVGPPRCLDALVHFGEFGFWNIYMKRADGCGIAALRLCNCIHGCAPCEKRKLERPSGLAATVAAAAPQK